MRHDGHRVAMTCPRLCPLALPAHINLISVPDIRFRGLLGVSRRLFGGAPAGQSSEDTVVMGRELGLVFLLPPPLPEIQRQGDSDCVLAASATIPVIPLAGVHQARRDPWVASWDSHQACLACLVTRTGQSAHSMVRKGRPGAQHTHPELQEHQTQHAAGPVRAGSLRRAHKHTVVATVQMRAARQTADWMGSRIRGMACPAAVLRVRGLQPRRLLLLRQPRRRRQQRLRLRQRPLLPPGLAEPEASLSTRGAQTRPLAT
mmetsp:Transcript_16070/g.47151  ORF Transcript_16070/g.47151 Transcript_16070/m.47151 type:complete len:260 (-) Transcript_16070:901-1680(-)